LHCRLVSLLVVSLAFALASACSREARDSGMKNGSFTFEHNGYSIHYEIHGSGPVLMTVPNSWGLTLAGLRNLYRPLEENLTFVYFDPRGMGASGPVKEDRDLGPEAVRDDFEALRKHLALDKVNAIGWSNGAENLIPIAAEHPDAIEAAIFVHGNASFLPEDQKAIVEGRPELVRAFTEHNREMQSGDFTVEEQNARTKAFDTEVWFPLLFHDPERGRKELPRIFGDADFSWAHAQYTSKNWGAPDLRPELPKIRARSLVIAGRYDVMPPERIREIADGIAGAEFVVFEESGHFAPVEEPEKFAATVLEFLKVPRNP
jgi:pimeloyl-ACP methyl ester carboxylesterase